MKTNNNDNKVNQRNSNQKKNNQLGDKKQKRRRNRRRRKKQKFKRDKEGEYEEANKNINFIKHQNNINYNIKTRKGPERETQRK